MTWKVVAIYVITSHFTTDNTTTVLRPFVRDYLGEPVPE